MGWFANIFSSSKAVDNVLDKDNGLLSQAGSWIGGMNFTAEEQAEFNERVSEGVSAFVKATLGENTERSKTRRMVAVLWIKAQIAMIFITMMVAPFNMELAKFYAGITFGTLMLTSTLSIIAFFFGPYMIGSHMVNKKQDNK